MATALFRSLALTHGGWRKSFAVFALTAAGVLGGCVALQPLLPLDASATVDGRAVKTRLEGAKGPLSVRRSNAILNDLSSRSEDTGIFERHLAIEEKVAGTALMVGNKTSLLQDGESTYAAMFKAIAGAKDHINMETYIIEDDAVGKQFSDALIAMHASGVQVNLIYDSVGSLQTPKEFFARLRAAGVNTLEFNPINPLALKKGWNLNQRDHRKLLIVDGKSVFLGGINISSVYSSGSAALRHKKADTANTTPWRDTHLLLEGPVVAEFQRMFIETWRKQNGGALAERNYFPQSATRGKEVVRAIGSSSDEGGGQMYRTILSAIDSAETSVYLTNAYFAPDQMIMDALRNAVQRGADVKLILPGKTDSGMIFHAGRSFYGELLSSGVKVYERGQALLHSKTALIDGVWSTIGSSNLDWRSFLHNDEVNAVILGPEFGAQMNAMFEKDLAASTQITATVWQGRSLLQRIKEQAARVWIYWL